MSAQLAIAAPRGSAVGGLRRLLAGVAVAGDRSLRRFLLGIYALCLLAGVGMTMFITGQHHRAELVLMLLAVATFFLWAFWFARAVLVQIAARAARMPALEREVPRGLAAMLAATVLLPGLVLAGFGVDATLALGTLACVALAGLLFALLPRGVAALMGFGPMLSNAVGLSDALGAIDVHRWLPALAAMLALCAWWRWRVVIAGGERMSAVSWWQPMVFALCQQRGLFGGWQRLGDANAQMARMPTWLQKVDLRGLGPATPVRALRAWLGAPFAPMTPRSRLLQLGLILGLSLLFPLAMISTRHHGEGVWFGLMAWVGLFGGMMLAIGFAPRLHGLRQRASGELAELALLPGWGGAAQARGILLRAVAVPLLATAAAMALMMFAAARMIGTDGAGYAMVVAALLGAVLTGGVACLLPLSGRALSLPWGLAYFALGLPLMAVTTIGIAPGLHAKLLAAGVLPWLFAAWLVMDVVLLGCIGQLWRRLQRRPHPFLLQ